MASAAKWKVCLQPLDQPTLASAALLFLRLVVGVAFLYHGWGKITNPFAWMGPDAPVPGFLQFLAAFSEFGGGLAFIAGLLTPLAAAGLGFTMVVAAFMHAVQRGDPFVNMTGGPSYELALVFLAICFVLLSVGPGRFSLDAVLFGRRR